jgi:uncharacterized damage-inducible protein DinB
MLKRTKGRLLLALLVITGLAGTIRVDSISQKERKFALKEMKETKSEVLQSVKGLSEEQLNFKTAADQWSVKECMYHIAIAEKNLWDLLENTMKTSPNSDKRSEIKMTDEQLIKMMEDRSFKVKTAEPFEPKSTPYKTLDDAVTDFKTRRIDHIKYLKTTTEDMRNHVVQMRFGWIDCYQLYLMIASHSNRHTQQINEVRSDPNFPKK